MGYIFDKMVVQCRFERVVLLFLVFGEPGFIVRVHNRGERRLLQCWPAVCLGCIRAKKCYFGKLDEQKSPGEVISGGSAPLNRCFDGPYELREPR